MSAQTAALGFSVHSGWAAMVVLGGTPAAPRVLDRSRVSLIDDRDPEAKQPYHAVEFLCVEEATGRLDGYLGVATRMARTSMHAQAEKLGKLGVAVQAVGILESASRKHVALSSILASHALIHAAEGDLFRNALSAAAEQLRIEVCRLQTRALEEHAMQCLQLPRKRLLDTVNGLGREVGPPWGADQKKAALLAWTLL
ncbi:MAG TPA: hypothetical protein VHW95_15780 [Steroidobacteraceae bacterium]|jgi:hypothetical protein|nr:hypothetical protein [Steroidobacteraceae bacterium]